MHTAWGQWLALLGFEPERLYEDLAFFLNQVEKDAPVARKEETDPDVEDPQRNSKLIAIGTDLVPSLAPA